MKYPSGKQYRKRISIEEKHLYTQSYVFLITQGLLLTAFGIADDANLRLVISILSILIALAWALCSWQNRKVIRDIKADYRKQIRPTYLEEIYNAALFRAQWLQPAFIKSVLLPQLFLLTWLLLFVMHLLKLLRLLILF